MANDIAFAENFTGILDAVYQRSSVSRCLNSGNRIIQASRHAKEIKIPKVSVTGLGDYTRNVGYKTGAITMTYETKVPNYDRAIRLMADVMDVEEKCEASHKSSRPVTEIFGMGISWAWAPARTMPRPLFRQVEQAAFW